MVEQDKINIKIMTHTQSFLEHSGLPPRFKYCNAQDQDENRKKLQLTISSTMNLVIIKGDIYGKTHMERFLDLLHKVRSHLMVSDRLNVYINIDKADYNGILLIHSLAEIASDATEQGKYFSVYWNTKGDNDIEQFVKSFANNFNCTFNYCDI